MAKKVITSLNIKNSDNTFTNVPIGIKAENVKLKNNRNLETSTAFLEDVEDASEFEAQKTPLYQEDVIDNLSTSTDNPISAKQGVILNARIIDNITGKIISSARATYEHGLANDCMLFRDCAPARTINIVKER